MYSRLRDDLNSRTEALDAIEADFRALREDNETLRSSHYDLREERIRHLEVGRFAVEFLTVSSLGA